MTWGYSYIMTKTGDKKCKTNYNVTAADAIQQSVNATVAHMQQQTMTLMMQTGSTSCGETDSEACGACECDPCDCGWGSYYPT